MFKALKSHLAYRRGKRALKQHDYATAERHFLKALEIADQNDKALAGLVTCAVARKQFEQALTYHDQLMARTDKLKPKLRAQDFVTRGQLLVKLERFIEASDAFAEALELDENNPQARLGRARILAAKGEHAEAVTLIQNLELPPDARADVLQAIAEIYLGGGHFDKAEAFFYQWQQQQPENMLAHLGLVRALQGQRKHEAALKIAQELVATYPKDVQLHLQVARLQQALRNFEDALKAVDQARRFDPSDAQVYFTRGDIMLDASHLSEAKRMFDKAIAIDPQHAAAYAQRGICKVLLSKGEAHGITRDFEFSEQFGGINPLVRRNRAIYAYALQNYDRAATLLEELLAAYPQFKWAAYYLGLVETARGNTDAAKAAYAQAIENGEEAAREQLAGL